MKKIHILNVRTFVKCCLSLCRSENEALWREVATLRQKHAQQQKVVNKVNSAQLFPAFRVTHTFAAQKVFRNKQST